MCINDEMGEAVSFRSPIRFIVEITKLERVPLCRAIRDRPENPERPPMRNVSARLVRIAAITVALVNSAASAIADDMPIEGQYLQNRRCKGDRTDPAGLKVTITPREITYAGGVCSIDSSRSEGDKFIFAVTCKFRSGSIMGADIAFTPLPGGSLHMVQQDGSFEADLYKCPN